MEALFDRHVLIPLALFLFITVTFKFLLDAIIRYRMLKEGVSADLLAEMLRHEARARQQSTLRWGVFLIAIGLGFALIEAFGWTEPTPGSLALLAILVGIGQLVTHRLSRQLP